MGVLDPTWFAGALWVHDGSMRKAGRPCRRHSSTARIRCHEMVYPTAHADCTGDSKQQPYSNCSCQSGTKQLTCLGVGTANYDCTAMNRHARSRRGGSWHMVSYDLCDAEQLFELYAVEAHSLAKPEHTIEYAGLTVCTVSKRWNAVCAAHGSMAMVMHGQEHSVMLLTKANNCNTSLAEKSLKDQLYAQQVRRQGWSVLWWRVVACISNKSSHAWSMQKKPSSQAAVVTLPHARFKAWIAR